MHRRLSRRDLIRHAGLALGAVPILGACASVEEPGGGATAGPTARPTATGTGAASATAAPPASASPTEAAAGPDLSGRSVTLLVYSGLTETLYRDLFVPQFAQRTGASVTIDAAWTEGIARLEAAPSDAPPFDLVLTDPTQGLPAVEQGLFQRFDTSLVPNAAANFHPNLLDATIYTEGYGIPFHSSAMTLATNTELVPEPLTTWGQLFTRTPEQGIMLYSIPYMSLYTFAEALAEADGMPPGSGAELLEQDLAGVLDFAAANADKVTYFWPSTTDGVTALVNGDVAAGNIHGNGLLTPIKEGAPVTGVIPPGTEAYAQLFFAVPAGVEENLDVALAALDHICSREFQQALAESGEYACAVPDIAEAYGRTDEVWAAAFPSSAQEFEDLRYYPYDVLAENAEEITRRWDAEVLRA
jgi:putative spermidine/putrescine transport system substrate-binding protein